MPPFAASLSPFEAFPDDSSQVGEQPAAVADA
jgi:hypothetical protein